MFLLVSYIVSLLTECIILPCLSTSGFGTQHIAPSLLPLKPFLLKIFQLLFYLAPILFSRVSRPSNVSPEHLMPRGLGKDSPYCISWVRFSGSTHLNIQLYQKSVSIIFSNKCSRLSLESRMTYLFDSYVCNFLQQSTMNFHNIITILPHLYHKTSKFTIKHYF